MNTSIDPRCLVNAHIFHPKTPCVLWLHRSIKWEYSTFGIFGSPLEFKFKIQQSFDAPAFVITEPPGCQWGFMRLKDVFGNLFFRKAFKVIWPFDLLHEPQLLQYHCSAGTWAPVVPFADRATASGCVCVCLCVSSCLCVCLFVLMQEEIHIALGKAGSGLLYPAGIE